MKVLAYSYSKNGWFRKYPQAGAVGGWSEWTPLPRGDALLMIENGWEHCYIA